MNCIVEIYIYTSHLSQFGKFLSFIVPFNVRCLSSSGGWGALPTVDRESECRLSSLFLSFINMYCLSIDSILANKLNNPYIIPQRRATGERSIKQATIERVINNSINIADTSLALTNHLNTYPFLQFL